MSLPTKASTSSLLCTPFLDTDTTTETAEADLELKSRGYPAWLIKTLRFFCGIGLWTQSLVWEEWRLDIGDVVLGYGPIFFVLGLITCLWSGLLRSPTVAMFGIGLLATGVLCVLFFIWHAKRERKRYEAWVEEHGEIDEP